MKKSLFIAIAQILAVFVGFGQFTDTTLYNFRDGTIITNGQSADGSLKLSGTYSHHGTKYGLNMKSGAQIRIGVNGACTIRFLGSQYSSLSMSGATKGGVSLTPAEQSTTVVNDLSDSYEFVYGGFADTLVFTATGSGSDVYLPQVEVFSSGKNYDFRDGTIIGDGQSADASLKISGSYSHHGTNYGMNMKSGAQIKIGVSGSCKVIFMGSQYSSLSMSGATDGGTSLEPAEQSTTVVNDLSDTYEFAYSGFADTLVFTATGAGSDVYLPKLQVVLSEPPVAYDFRDGTIITDGQSADGSLKLSGTYSHHGAKYGLNMKSGAQIQIGVNGSGTIRFLGSQYSSLSISGATKGGESLTPAEQSTAVVNDLSDYYEFTYGGEKDTLVFTATGSGSDIYLPLIEYIPGTVETVSWVQKSGSIIINNDTINLSAGASAADDAIVSLAKGTVESTTPESALVRLDLSGNSLDSYTPVLTGDISEVVLSNDTIYVAYADSTAQPYGYIITVMPPWQEKSGTVTINGIDINLTTGATPRANSVVALSEGTVVRASAEVASIRIDLAGNSLGSYTPSISGDIAEVTLSNDTIIVAYSDSTKEPYGYIIKVADNSLVVEAEPGKTYNYNLADGSVMPQTDYKVLRYNTFVSEDGILTINSNTDTESLKFGFHDSSHGAVIFPGNSFDLAVSANAIVTFITCQYGTADAVFVVSDTSGTVLDTIKAGNKGADPAGEGTSSFAYSGEPSVLTFILNSASTPSGETYIHGLNIANAPVMEEPSGKIDVWDFGAEELDTSIYQNRLNADVINAWYDASVTAGSSGNVMPGSFSAGVLSWTGGGNDRLRTTNTSLTRYDENISGVSGYTGRLYVNSSSAVGRYLSLTLREDDEVTLVALSQNGSGMLNFKYVADPAYQTDHLALGADANEYKFVAKQGGTYHIFDNQDKPSYYRVYRKDAAYVTVTGNVDLSQASGIPGSYAIQFTNEAGKTWTATMNTDNYFMRLPIGYTYDLSLLDANGYVISSGNSLNVTDTTTTFNVAIQKVELFTVSGSISGLNSEIGKLSLVFNADTAAHKIYVPEPVIDAGEGTYTVQLEPACAYTIVAEGVNDYYLPLNTITIGSADETFNIDFSAKPVYNITIEASGLSEVQMANLDLTFTNLYEDGYSYAFDTVAGIQLRDGTYTIAYSGLDAYPVKMGLTSNLTVDGADTNKTLAFYPITQWSFEDKVIANGDIAYNGLLFTGSIANEVAKGHLSAKPAGTIKVPVNAGDQIKVTYYYSADFSIEGTSYSTSSSSTSKFEYAYYTYTGTEAGYVTITIGSGASTTYITNIAIGSLIDYKPVVYVGTDKEYQSINEALDAIANMARSNTDRVTVMIDPGNYEEMLVIDVPSVTFKNASLAPDTKILNKGVDISGNAVRITSYYGHGYNYYSMNNQKWDAEVLRVNKENGYLSYENTGSGTTNGSYWNATVVVAANGFEADHIIFENSFNQYISQKESEDVVVMWESGNKGERPTDYGNTTVQNKSFVERAAAISITNNSDKTVLNRCRVIGRQDSFFGGDGARVAIYKGQMMGTTDYIFGAMTAVFYKSDLVLNNSDDKNDVAYITAAQQSSGRGYLMYNCTITSPEPGVESASAYKSKPGYFGRPWKATTSEVVFHKTNIETTNFPGSVDESLIKPLGWNSSLGGESPLMYEYGTVEKSGEDNQASRATWATLLSDSVLSDGTEISTYNFTKGSDNWDPFPALIASDTIVDEDPNTAVPIIMSYSNVKIFGYQDKLVIRNITSNSQVEVYNLNGALVNTFEIHSDAVINYASGMWIVRVRNSEGIKVEKVLIQ